MPTGREESLSKMDLKWTWVRIRLGTKDRLLKLGKKGDTYDDIIRTLLDEEIK